MNGKRLYLHRSSVRRTDGVITPQMPYPFAHAAIHSPLRRRVVAKSGHVLQNASQPLLHLVKKRVKPILYPISTGSCRRPFEFDITRRLDIPIVDVDGKPLAPYTYLQIAIDRKSLAIIVWRSLVIGPGVSRQDP